METLKNARGNTIGRIHTDRNGKQTIKDAKGKTLGGFDPNSNKTKDTRGRTIGTGNLLSSLIINC